jgi:hypothetical protein
MSRSTRIPAPAAPATPWTRARSAAELRGAAYAVRVGETEGPRWVADVLTHVLEELQGPLGTFAWTPVDGDYPFDWVGVDFPVGTTGAKVRVATVDIGISGGTVWLFDRHGVELGKATFENLPAHLAAAIVVAEVTSL